MTHRLLLIGQASAAHGPMPDPGWRANALGPATLLTSPDTNLSLFGGELAIVGDAFDVDGKPLVDLPRGQAHAIVASDGRWLAERVWGRFLAVWIDRMGRGIGVYRDPSGQVPLYFKDGEPLLAFTDLDDALPWLPRLDVDAKSLAHRLVYGQLQTAECAVAGIRELLPGEATLLPAGAARLLWSPWHHAPDRRSARAAPDPVGLRDTIIRTVDHLTCGADASLLELSGGLDSSILATALARSGRRWSAINVTTPGAEGDEREWARAVADHLGAVLTMVAVEAADIDLDPPERLTPNPGGFGTIRAIDHAISGAAVRAGRPLLVSGTGGDNVFCSLRSPAPVLDALRIGGPAAALRAANDLATLTSTDLWAVAAAAIRYARLERRFPIRWRANHDLLTVDCRPTFRIHPWLDAPHGRLSGSRGQVVMLLGAHSVLAAHDRVRRMNMVFPLLAQPVLEACLAIASPYWIVGGRDRSVAREAFASLLPETTIARRSKGHVHGLIARAYDRNRVAIADRLTEGRLARLGIIDAAAVRERARRPAAADDAYSRLLDLLDAELWLESIDSRATF